MVTVFQTRVDCYVYCVDSIVVLQKVQRVLVFIEVWGLCEEYFQFYVYGVRKKGIDCMLSLV